VNDHKQIAGFTTVSGKEVGYALFNGSVIFLSAPGAEPTQGFGINNGGDIVGIYVGSDSLTHAFLRTR
jgi:hypothetical protein